MSADSYGACAPHYFDTIPAVHDDAAESWADRLVRWQLRPLSVLRRVEVRRLVWERDVARAAAYRFEEALAQARETG